MPGAFARILPFLLPLWAAGCARATEQVSPAVAPLESRAEGPSPPPPSPEIIELLRRTAPRDSAGSPEGGPDGPSGGGIFALCARDVLGGLELCKQLAPGDPSECSQVCLNHYRTVHQPPRRPLAPAAVPSAYPYVVALDDCIRRVRDGDGSPACRFFRPLDEMDFGQRHCDSKCRELTEGYRAGHAAP